MKMIDSCVVILALSLSLPCSNAASRLSSFMTKSSSLLHTHQTCLEYVEYLPSSWEDEWLSISKQLDTSVCNLMEKQNSKANLWIQDIASAIPPQFNKQRQIWSFFKYRNLCSGSSRDFVFVPIEPTVGLLRHPLATPCYADQIGLNVEDRGYLMPATVSQIQLSSGRKLLFDLGSGISFASSLQWFVDAYEQRGVTFDEIWCWEPSQMDHHQYWASVPDRLVSKLHYYNTYAAPGFNASAPVGILQDRAERTDFVVLKLDIDNDAVEDQILQSVLEVKHLVGEMYFEKHFDNAEMRPFFGEGLRSNLYDVLIMFRELRQSGLRLHYWP